MPQQPEERTRRYNFFRRRAQLDPCWPLLLPDAAFHVRLDFETRRGHQEDLRNNASPEQP